MALRVLLPPLGRTVAASRSLGRYAPLGAALNIIDAGPGASSGGQHPCSASAAKATIFCAAMLPAVALAEDRDEQQNQMPQPPPPQQAAGAAAATAAAGAGPSAAASAAASPQSTLAQSLGEEEVLFRFKHPRPDGVMYAGKVGGSVGGSVGASGAGRPCAPPRSTPRPALPFIPSSPAPSPH